MRIFSSTNVFSLSKVQKSVSHGSETGRILILSPCTVIWQYQPFHSVLWNRNDLLRLQFWLRRKKFWFRFRFWFRLRFRLRFRLMFVSGTVMHSCSGSDSAKAESYGSCGFGPVSQHCFHSWIFGKVFPCCVLQAVHSSTTPTPAISPASTCWTRQVPLFVSLYSSELSVDTSGPLHGYFLSQCKSEPH